MIDGVEADDKIIAVTRNGCRLRKDPGYQPGSHRLIDRLRHYFLSYKQLPGEAPRRVEIAEVYNREEAAEAIRRSNCRLPRKIRSPKPFGSIETTAGLKALGNPGG